MMGRVFIKNFGDGNYMWPRAKDRAEMTLISDSVSFEYVTAGDERGYRDYVSCHLKTSRNKVPDKSTQTLWWNSHERFSSITQDDLIVHDDGTHLYWTQIELGSTTYETEPDPHPFGRENAMLTISVRPTQGWSYRNRKGHPLLLRGLHPRVREILRTQMTMATARLDYAAYAHALIAGENLSEWHERPDWKAALEEQRWDALAYVGDWEKQKTSMAYNALAAVGQSGHKTTNIRKTEDFGFENDKALKRYIDWLQQQQGGRCALTGLTYKFVKDNADRARVVSLDRIDSTLGYVPGNLQLTCHFANMWKGASDNTRFIELIESVKAMQDKVAPNTKDYHLPENGTEKCRLLLRQSRRHHLLRQT
jgi:hypothetical protein